jgi:pimeloyl-ACP methyl ester carboxylesterase
VPEPVSFRGGAGVISALRWPGRTNVGLLLAHATGFCKEVWTPLVDVLREGYDGSVTAWDSRGHGESEPGELPFDWWDFAADVHAVIQQSSDAKRFGMGHSMGGAALAMAEILRPGTFEALVLIEPIVFRPPFGRFENPMVDGALRRKAVFPSPSAAFSNFASKPAFARWDVEVMDAYVQGALVDEAGDWRLRCRPEHEADVYRGGSAHGAYERLEEIVIPVLLMAGEHSDTHDGPFLEDLRSRFGNATSVVISDAGHFLPMEQPAAVAQIAVDFFNDVTT